MITLISLDCLSHMACLLIVNLLNTSNQWGLVLSFRSVRRYDG